MIIDDINFTSQKSKFYFESNEYNVLDERGVRSKLTNIKEQLWKQNTQKMLTKHLKGMHDDLLKYHWFPNDIFDSIQKDKEHEKRNARLDYAIKNKNFHNMKFIYYGDNPNWYGNMADAFVNHLAHLHIQIFAGDAFESNFGTSVFNEEKKNIYKLIADSTNNTAWYTGGDIIIKYQGQLFNIQLKTVQGNLNNIDKIGKTIATHDLSKQLLILKQNINNTNVLIEKMFNFFKTTGWIEPVNQAIYLQTKDIINPIEKFDNSQKI